MNIETKSPEEAAATTVRRRIVVAFSQVLRSNVVRGVIGRLAARWRAEFTVEFIFSP
ncbi:hypothetical protein [Sanguibacter antarcticus]|uniref:hypothetical protein n=1 Tax=Sanguibacter antarcticus TaxID=372484 RepID=UPI001FE73C7D|nr:hypothetical protein [Sanguibacter antarcticus]